MPQATLKVEVSAINPPKPTSVAVIVDGKPIAWVDLDEMRRAIRLIDQIEAERRR